MSNALDMIAEAYWGHGAEVFQIKKSRVLFAHAETAPNTDKVFVKQWQKALAHLLS